MSDNKQIVARDPDIIAAEINTIKREAWEVVIAASIKIGGKLKEAKAMLPHGEWGKWLEDHVEYSQSTANNLMQLHTEYGQGQVNLFDNWTNSETFGKLGYSKHLALLALPFDERREFAESVGAEDLSTRELKEAIRIRDEKLNAAAESEVELEQQLDAANKARAQWEDRAAEVKREKEEAQAKVKALEHALSTAEAAQKKANEALEQAQKNPKIPQSKLEQLQIEAAKAASERVAMELMAAQKEAKEAAEAAKQAQQKAEEYRREAESLQKKATVANPDAVVLNALVKKLQVDWNIITGHLQKVDQADPQLGEKCKALMRAVLQKLLEAVE